MSEDPTPYGNHSEITELRLQLHCEKLRADAFEAALSKAVMTVIKKAATQADENAKACADVRDHQSYLKQSGQEKAFMSWLDWRYQNTQTPNSQTL